MKRAFVIVVSLAALLAVVGCAGCASSQAHVRIGNSGFDPAQISVKAGTTVTWTNEGTTPHTVTGDDFDSGAVYPKTTYSHTFDRAGTFPYECRFHPTESGTVIVR